MQGVSEALTFGQIAPVNTRVDKSDQDGAIPADIFQGGYGDR